MLDKLISLSFRDKILSYAKANGLVQGQKTLYHKILGLVEIELEINEEDEQKLVEMSEERGITVAELMDEMLREYIKDNGRLND